MTGVTFTARFEDDELAAGIRRLITLARDPTEITEAIGLLMVQNTERRIDGPNDANGEPWAPLLPAYAIMKTGPGILRETKTLQRTLTFFAGSGEVIWGSAQIYAAAQQFGVTIVPKVAPALSFRLGAPGGGTMWVHRQSVTLPARPYLGIDEEDQLGIVEIVDRSYERALYGRAL